MENLQYDIQWTDLIAQSLEMLHKRGVPPSEIQRALRIMPFHPAMVRASNKAKSSREHDVPCLSNANSVFISTILEDKKLTELFTEVITNPAEFEDSGLLKLRRRVDPDGPQHKCTVGCSPNMCKGDELDAFLSRHGAQFDKVIYVGDGSNDFCPVLRLRSEDLVLCRQSFGLQKRINNEGGLKCQAQYWEGAWEVEEIFDKH
ncbi:phosphatase phospho-type [Flagelloscypha sp. PMI_526]|nr:phosphatase phospho-type [Flagelloscypha sp. PMI_526]